MKKFIKVLAIIAFILAFSGCSLFKSEESEKVEPAVNNGTSDDDTKISELEKKIDEKVEVDEDETDSNVAGEKDATIDELEEKIASLEAQLKEEPKEDVKTVYTGSNYITLNKPENEASFHEQPIIFAGVVSPTTKKIVVTAKNGDPNCGPDADGICITYSEDVYTLKDFKYGDSTFIYRANTEWSNLQYGSNDYIFKAYFDDGSTKTTSVKIFLSTAGAEMGKPVIYLYPEKETEVYVNVKPTNGISVSEPRIDNGWNVVATPEGQIYNRADGKAYPYLFWEGFAVNFKTPKEGFVIAAKDVEKFFDNKLSILGLNQKEIADFKEFWVPRLSGKTYYFITFIPQADFDNYAPLTVNPKPNSIIRVFFDYKGLDNKIVVKEQQLLTPERKGFTVVEWGGRLYR